jgi:hypothetical protein
MGRAFGLEVQRQRRNAGVSPQRRAKGRAAPVEMTLCRGVIERRGLGSPEDWTGLGDAGEEGAEFFGMVAVGEGGVAGDAAGTDQIGEGLVHGGHAVDGAGGDLGAHLVVLRGADEVADGGGGDHDFHDGIAAGMVGCGDELLGDDGKQGEGELLADLGLVAGGKTVEEAGHGLGGVVGVEGGEDEVAGFGGGEGGGHGLGIAHLADEDDVGILAEDGADGVGEARGVATDFDLLDDGVAVGVLVFDGIFDGDDVLATAGVDEVDERGHGGGFAGAGGAGEKDEALAALGEAGEDGREVQGFYGGDLGGKEPDAGGEGASLVVEVDAETAGGGADETEVERAAGFEFGGLVLGEEREDEGAEVFGGEEFAGAGGEDSVDAVGDGGASDEEEVRGVLGGGLGQEWIEGGLTVDVDFQRGGLLGGAVELVDKLREIVFVVWHQSSSGLRRAGGRVGFLGCGFG